MNKLIATALAFAACAMTPALADEAADKAAAKDHLCSAIAKYAETIMSNRQHGVPLQKMLDSIAEAENKAIVPVARTLLITAYKEPGFSTEEMQQKTIREFTTKAQVMCLDAMAAS